MNDISLPLGGRFAISGWNDNSHREHRQGIDADMYYHGWDYGSQIWKFMKSAIIDATTLTPLHDPQWHYNHFHTNFPGRSED